MAFELANVIPWGRNLTEYKSMFGLSVSDLDKRIISFGDGPASFNCEMTMLGKSVISIDPIYQFSEEQLNARIEESRGFAIEQTKKNIDNFIWQNIRNVEELEQTRMSAMNKFIDDYTSGKKQGRYISHELPERTDFDDLTFDIGLSSHFLILYDQLGLEFHIQSIREMMRLCKEIRIFPILNLDAKKSEVLDGIIEFFGKEYDLQIQPVDYEFQKGGNKMLTLKRRH